MYIGIGMPLTALARELFPALGLDFLLGTLDSRITFTRADATSCATYFDSTGRLQTAAANVARFDYDPSTVASYVAPIFSANNASAGVTTSGFNIAGLSGTATVASGKRYLITYTITSLVGQLSAFIDTVSGTAQGINATGSFTDTITAATTGSVSVGLIARGSGVTSVTGSVSVQEVVYSPRGLLIEESRTNLLLQSRDMTNAAWTKTDVTPARTQVGIDGTANSACLMTEGSAGTAQTQQAGTITAAQTCTVSGVFKRGNNDWIRLAGHDGAAGAAGWFNLSTGAKGTLGVIGGGTANGSSITSLGGGWYRCTVTFTGVSGTAGTLLVFCTNADNSTTRVNNATYIVDAAQLEVGSFATSPIITTAATVTRAADSASMTGSNFSSWWNATNGTIVAEWSGLQASKSVYRVGTAAAGAIGISQTSPNTLVDKAGTGTLITNSNFATTSKNALAYDGTGMASATNGGTVGTTATTMTASTQLGIGMNLDVTSQAGGWIRRITYYPTKLSNAQLQSLTT